MVVLWGLHFPSSLFSFYFSERHTHTHHTLTHKLRDQGCLVLVQKVSELGGRWVRVWLPTSTRSGGEGGVVLCLGTKCHMWVQA